jgi:undecaprenyl-diphosphatase
MSATTSPLGRAETRARANGILRPSRHPVAVLVIAVVAVAIITSAGYLLSAHAVDLSLSEGLNALHVGVLGSVTSLVYHLFSPIPAVIITVVVTGIVWVVSRRLRVAIAFAGVVAITWIPSDLVKLLVHRARPDIHLMAHPFTPVQLDPSYPSGHTVFVTALVIGLILVLRGTRWMPVAVVLGAVLILGVALSLAIDAVHYPTDVLASIAWSICVAPAVRLIWVDWLMPLVPFLRERQPR